MATNATDKYCQLSQNTATQGIKQFINAICHCFDSKYSRHLTCADIQKQIDINICQQFLYMFAFTQLQAINVENCLVAWQGQFQDNDKNYCIILEAIAN